MPKCKYCGRLFERTVEHRVYCSFECACYARSEKYMRIVGGIVGGIVRLRVVLGSGGLSGNRAESFVCEAKAALNEKKKIKNMIKIKFKEI